MIAILRDPATQMVVLAGQAPAPTARARMMWHAKAGGVFVAAGLPAAPAGKAYQLWAIAGSTRRSRRPLQRRRRRGREPLGAAAARVATVDAFAVTLEPAGGLPAPSGAMYLLGKSWRPTRLTGLAPRSRAARSTAITVIASRISERSTIRTTSPKSKARTSMNSVGSAGRDVGRSPSAT